MRMIPPGFCLTAVLLLLPATAPAQALPFGLSLDARGGMAMPLGEFTGSEEGFDAQAGPGWAVGGTLLPSHSFGVFAAYQRGHFGCERCAVFGLEDAATTSGVEGGLHIALGSPWIRGGVVWQTLTFSGFDGEMSSEPALGFNGGFGFAIPLTGGVEAHPAIRYFRFPAEFDFRNFPDRSIDVSAYSLDIGVSYRL